MSLRVSDDPMIRSPDHAILNRALSLRSRYSLPCQPPRFQLLLGGFVEELQVALIYGEVVGSSDRKSVSEQQACNHLLAFSASPHQATGEDELGAQVFHVLHVELEGDLGSLANFLSQSKMFRTKADNDAVIFDHVHRLRSYKRGREGVRRVVVDFLGSAHLPHHTP